MTSEIPPSTQLPASPEAGSNDLRDLIAKAAERWALIYPLANYGFWACADDSEQLAAIAKKLAAAWGGDIADAVMAVFRQQAARAEDVADGTSIGELREALTFFTDLGGAWGANMHESKQVLLRVEGRHVYRLAHVEASFHEGRIVIMLDSQECRLSDFPSDVQTARDQADRAQQAEATIGRVQKWVTSDVVTARTPFGDGYREAMRDVRDLLTPLGQPAKKPL